MNGALLYLATMPYSSKKIVYEMRFDEASSRYGDFPYFMVGVHLKKEAVPAFLSL